MKKFVEVKHFNIPVDLSMYDKLPYSINPNTKKQISLVSGNVLKYYNVTMDEEKKVIDPNDSNPDIIDSEAKELSTTSEDNISQDQIYTENSTEESTEESTEDSIGADESYNDNENVE